MKTLNKFNTYFVKQHGDFSCGVACLSMIIKYYGGNIRQEQLQAISGTSLQGTSLLGLYQAANTVGFKASGLQADKMSSLKDLKEPCILHVVKNNKEEHFIVCFGFFDDRFIIGDPSWGILRMSDSELEAIWVTKALLKFELTDKFIQEQTKKNSKAKWLLEILKTDYPILIMGFFFGILIALLGLVTAIFSQKLIDELLPSHDYKRIVGGISLFLVLLLFRTFFEYLRNIFSIRQARDFNNRLINTFFSKILFLPKSFFDATKTGEILSRMNDSKRIQQTVTYLVGSIFVDSIITILFLVYLCTYSWIMALIAFSCIPFFIVLILTYNKKIIEGQSNIMVAYAATESLFIDSIQGVNDIKVANKQNFFKQHIKVCYGIYQDYIYKLGIIGSRYSAISQSISTFIIAFIIIVGTYFVLNNSLTLGELMAVITLSSMIISTTANLSNVNIRIKEADIAFDRFFEFAQSKPEFEKEDTTEEEEKNVNRNCSLHINNLSYRFIGRKKLLENVSFHVSKGEIVSIFGEVGSGKSTLIQILLKHYSPETGDVLLNGNSMYHYSIPIWRKYIGVVDQNTKIFNGSVGENICLDNYEEERDNINEFNKKYGFDAFIESLPQGVNTLLGENGINISGGQRQLIAIARALYQNPSVLLLDEPTSSMDAKTELFILDLIKELRKELAIVIITHRKHLAEVSTRNYLLESGILREI